MNLDDAKRILDLDDDDPAESFDEKTRLLRSLLGAPTSEDPDFSGDAEHAREVLREMMDEMKADAAAKRAEKAATGRVEKARPEARVVEALYAGYEDVKARRRASASTTRSCYGKAYALDQRLAVAVLAIETDYNYCKHDSDSDERVEHSGTQVEIVLLNRLPKQGMKYVRPASQSYLIDDKGYQYSPQESEMNWIDPNDGEGYWHTVPDIVAPGAKIEGFLMFPRLRSGSTCFRAWYWNDDVRVGGGYYDVELHVDLR